MTVNKQIILGRLGQDPEVRMTQSGQQVANLSVATTEYFTKDGKREEKTEWHRVVLWGKLAENASKYLKKGNQVYLEGRTETRVWEKEGQKHYVKEVVANEMRFVGNKSETKPDTQSQASEPANNGYGRDLPADDDDVPF